MTYQRLAYDDAAPAPEMTADCRAVEAALHLPAGRRPVRRTPAERALGPAPSLRFEDRPRELAKPELTVSDAAVRLAAALHLHLD